MFGYLDNEAVELICMYDGLLHEWGSRCETGLYMDQYLSLVREYIRITGTSDRFIVVIDGFIDEYMANKKLRCCEKMLEHLAIAKKTILELNETGDGSACLTVRK